MADTKPSLFTTDATPLDTALFPYMEDAGGGTFLNRKLSWLELKAALGTEVTKHNGSTQTMSSTTGTAITALSGDTLAAGTYRYRGDIIWQSAATTTGISLYVQGTGGTVTRNVGHTYTTTTGGAATTGIADQATVAATFQMLESRAWRANGTNPGAHGGVDTATADQYSVIEGTIVVSVATVLNVMFSSEVAASNVSIMAGSSFMYERVA